MSEPYNFKLEFPLDLNSKVDALGVSDEQKKQVIDIVFWAMEKAAEAVRTSEGKTPCR